MHTDHLQPGENQQPIPGWDGYFVTDFGRVFSFKRQGYGSSSVHLDASPRELGLINAFVGVTKRRVVVISLNNGRLGKRVLHLAHLVMLAFVGPRPPHSVVCHYDDNVDNNALANLRYASQTDNAADARRNGRTPQGERNPRAKLTSDAARRVRGSSKTIAEIAAEFGVTRSCIEGIKRNERWAHVGGPLIVSPSRRGRKPKKL